MYHTHIIICIFYIEPLLKWQQCNIHFIAECRARVNMAWTSRCIHKAPTQNDSLMKCHCGQKVECSVVSSDANADALLLLFTWARVRVCIANLSKSTFTSPQKQLLSKCGVHSFGVACIYTRFSSVSRSLTRFLSLSRSRENCAMLNLLERNCIHGYLWSKHSSNATTTYIIMLFLSVYILQKYPKRRLNT